MPSTNKRKRKPFYVEYKDPAQVQREQYSLSSMTLSHWLRFAFVGVVFVLIGYKSGLVFAPLIFQIFAYGAIGWAVVMGILIAIFGKGDRLSAYAAWGVYMLKIFAILFAVAGGGFLFGWLLQMQLAQSTG